MRWIASLQTPYLLTLASLVIQYLPTFPSAPKVTFRLLDKFDLAFASLLQSRHVETGEPLPGFDGGRAISVTDKVRLKSLVDRTRIVVTDVISRSGGEIQVEELTDLETGDEMSIDESENGDGFDDLEMGITKVYDRTVVELGENMAGSPIGIITDI